MSMAVRVAQSELISGMIFTAIGVGFALMAGEHRLGTAVEMGPGYFPLLLSLLLSLVGCILLFRAFLVRDTTEIPFKALPIALITLSLVIFALTINRLGVLVATFLATLIAAYAGDQFRWRSAIIMALVLSVFCWLIFIKAIGLPFPAIGSWLRW